MTDRYAVDLFASSCANLGAQVCGRTQIPDLRMARDGFARLTSQYPDQCDGWRGRAAAGDLRPDIVENAYRSLDSCGELIAAADAAPAALDFAFDTGMYVTLPAAGADGVRLATAAVRTAAGDYAAAKDLLDDRLLASQPLFAGWILAVTYFRAARWHDVRRVLAPLLTRPCDAYLGQAITVAYGYAGAHLGLWDQSLDLLASRGRGPIPAATAEALLVAGLCARALDQTQDATALLNEAYGVSDVDEDLRARIATALSDPEFGIFATNPARIDARTDYWDPATEPGDREYARALGADRREKLKAEAAEALAGFVGMAGVKEEIARLESSARADKRRAAKGLPVKNRSLHLVLKGPPGVGKTTIARVIGKLLCAAEVLPTEKFVEVGRGDLVDNVIGGSEAKVLAVLRSIIDSGGGVLFIDEAYALTDSGSKNDFGPLIIAELIRAMVNHADSLMVIAAGYADKMDEFLDSNEGLSSRFGREIHLPSYTPEELVEITCRAAARDGSVFADTTALHEIYSRLAASHATDTTGRTRSALDVAGNGRFANTLLEQAGEDRDYRLEQAGLLDDPDTPAEQLQTITDADVRAAATRALRKLKIEGIA